MTAVAQAVARDAYDALADAYDALTGHHDHERWIRGLLERALPGGGPGRAFDIACGTGKSFTPLLTRGWTVHACDVSPRMVARARRRHPDAERGVFVADMRALPRCGPFELVTCLDDALNYLVSDDDLVAAFRQVEPLLAPDGRYVFDVNSARTYRKGFRGHEILERDGRVFCWRGEPVGEAPTNRFTAVIDVFEPEGGCWRRTTSRHLQRHHPPARVRSALEAAGLELVHELGQRTGAVLHDRPDDATDTKLVYVARRARRLRPEATRKEASDEDRHADRHAVAEAAPVAGDVVAGDHAAHARGAAPDQPARAHQGLAVPFSGHLLW